MAVMAPAMSYPTVVRRCFYHQHTSQISVSNPRYGNLQPTEPLLLEETGVISIRNFQYHCPELCWYIQNLLHQRCRLLRQRIFLGWCLPDCSGGIVENIYSLHGLPALMGPPSGQACHWLIGMVHIGAGIGAAPCCVVYLIPPDLCNWFRHTIIALAFNFNCHLQQCLKNELEMRTELITVFVRLTVL